MGLRPIQEDENLGCPILACFWPGWGKGCGSLPAPAKKWLERGTPGVFSTGRPVVMSAWPSVVPGGFG